MAILKDLIVHGSSRFLNKIYAEELETSAFEAESAIIKKLTAKDATLENATVIGLLDVQGQLHTNTWTNSNIATIDGCFYITPTLSSDSGKISFSSTSVASLTGTYTAVTSLYIGDSSSGSTVQWTKDSNILLTGEVEVNGQWLPLGTLLGTLSANATTSSIGLTGLTDNRHNPSSIITDIRNAVSSTALDYRNLKISLYQRKDGNDSKPLGIYMTAMGTNGKTFIDIYGGVNATTTAGSSGGFADPNLRIGNLSGLGAVEGTTPTGWGIYTTNGYFKGVIVSSAGKIGNFTINSALYSNGHSAWNSNVSGIYINNDGISGGAGGKWWLWNDGSAKIGEMTLSAAGVLTVPAAYVSGELTAATINGSKISAGDIAAARIQTNLISAINAKVSDISALTATLGGFQVDTTAIHTKNVAITSNADNSIALSSADFTRTINSTSRAGLRFAIGDKFGITGDGAIYASSATISGNITATSLTLGSGVTIGYSSISNPPTIPTTVAELTDSGSYLTTSAASSTYATQTAANNAAKTATTYITDIDSKKGITIKPANTSGNDYLQINSSAINFYRNNVETLKIEDSAIRVGKIGENKQNVYITDGAVQIRDNEDVLAKFSADGVIIGNADNLNIRITSDRMLMYSKSTPTIQLITGDDTRPVTNTALYATFPFSTVTTRTYVVDSEQNNFFKYSTSVKALFDVTDNSNTTTERLGRSFTFGTSASKTMSYDTPDYTFSCSCTIEYDGAYTFIIKNWTYSNIKRVAFYIDYDLEEAAPNVILGTTTAKSFGAFSVTEGDNCQASGDSSHAEGENSKAIGSTSHTEGVSTIARGGISHAEGYLSKANGYCSHAQNFVTTAESDYQTAIGKFNILDSDNTYSFIIGNGTLGSNRSNALTVDWNGNVQMYLDTINVELDNNILTAIQSLGWEDDVID